MNDYQKIVQAIGKLTSKPFLLRGTPSSQSELEAMLTIITGEDAEGTAIESSETSDRGFSWSDVQGQLASVDLDLVREERDRLLSETDWWASSDLTMTQAQTDYRQALRDITDNATSLDDVTWPTKP